MLNRTYVRVGGATQTLSTRDPWEGWLIAATAILAVAPTIASLALMLAVALVPALLTPLLSARLNDLIPSRQRATILSLGALLFELGLAVAMPLMLAFADHFGAPAAIGLSSAVFAVTAIPLMLVWRVADSAPAPAAPSG